MHGQGVPLIMPINQSAAVKAVLTDSKISKGLYTALGVDTNRLKKTISAEITRGIASGMNYADIARNVNAAAGTGFSNATRIVRTEGHRIQQAAADDARYNAKSKGADVLKQWDATLDGNTRESHRQVDGEIRELDEKFSNGLMYPGDPAGGAAEVVNCRCVAHTRARWNLNQAELDTLKDRAKFFGLDKTENFKEFEEKYLKSVEKSVKSGKIVLGKNADNTLSSRADPMADAFGAGVDTNPVEIAAFRDELKRDNVQLIEREVESLGYCPGLARGTPGTVYISKGASFGAWSHEITHFRDDRDAGWLGMSVIADPDLRYKWEAHAYNVEIDMALKAGRKDVADKLRANLEEERKRIYGE